MCITDGSFYADTFHSASKIYVAVASSLGLDSFKQLKTRWYPPHIHRAAIRRYLEAHYDPVIRWGPRYQCPALSSRRQQLITFGPEQDIVDKTYLVKCLQSAQCGQWPYRFCCTKNHTADKLPETPRSGRRRCLSSQVAELSTPRCLTEA